MHLTISKWLRIKKNTDRIEKQRDKSVEVKKKVSSKVFSFMLLHNRLHEY